MVSFIGPRIKKSRLFPSDIGVHGKALTRFYPYDIYGASQLDGKPPSDPPSSPQHSTQRYSTQIFTVFLHILHIIETNHHVDRYQGSRS